MDDVLVMVIYQVKYGEFCSPFLFLFLVKNTKRMDIHGNVFSCDGYVRMQMNDGLHRVHKPLAFLFRLT